MIIKRQFSKGGNLTLQAIIDKNQIKSIRCFMEADGREIKADPELFEILENGNIQLKAVRKISDAVKKTIAEFVGTSQTGLHGAGESLDEAKETNIERKR